jgi:hypothetical protein
MAHRLLNGQLIMSLKFCWVVKKIKKWKENFRCVLDL